MRFVLLRLQEEKPMRFTFSLHTKPHRFGHKIAGIIHNLAFHEAAGDEGRLPSKGSLPYMIHPIEKL
jgi:hypothetical protein